MKEKKQGHQTVFTPPPCNMTFTEWAQCELEYQNDTTISRGKLMRALSAFNRRYRSRQREEKE